MTLAFVMTCTPDVADLRHRAAERLARRSGSAARPAGRHDRHVTTHTGNLGCQPRRCFVAGRVAAASQSTTVVVVQDRCAGRVPSGDSQSGLVNVDH